MERLFYIYVVMCLLLGSGVYAQNTKELDIQQAVDLALQNHQQLKVSAKSVELAEQNTAVVKLQQLPNITASASAGYLGDVLFLDKNFSKVRTLDMPHFGNSYAVQASELLYKGGLIKKSIEATQIKTQLAELDLIKDQQAVKFLVISNYLDIYKLHNQLRVYENNQKLAQLRLENVKKYYTQGIVTRNEVIRGELALQQIEQALLVIHNNIDILNYNLSMALGLPEETYIKPVESISDKFLTESRSYYLNIAYSHHPSLDVAQKNIDLAEKNIQIINTEKYPSVAAVSGYTMQRPFINNNPPLDVYYNSWMVGVSLSYNIDNLYKTKEKLKAGKIQKTQVDEASILIKQNVEMSVNSAYVKYNEAIKNANILLESQRLAQENYKITEAKYFNQLAILADMTDASNTRLEAELQYTNALINILYQYYNLIKTTGTL